MEFAIEKCGMLTMKSGKRQLMTKLKLSISYDDNHYTTGTFEFIIRTRENSSIIFTNVERAGIRALFTVAIPLLPDTVSFVCCISALDRVAPSLVNQVNSSSLEPTILMPDLVRTPDQHNGAQTRDPILKHSNKPPSS